MDIDAGAPQNKKMRKPLFLIIVLFLSVSCATVRDTGFGNDYRAAVKAARREGKPLVVALLKHDNKLSQTMAEDVLADSQVVAMYSSRFVPVLLWDDAPGADELFADYRFSYYPALVFLSPEGDFLNKQAGYKDTEDMLALADDYLHPQADRLDRIGSAFK